MADAVTKACDAVVADHIAAAGELDAFAFVVTTCAHDRRVPLADAGDDVVLDAGAHHAGLVSLDAKLRVDDAAPHSAVFRAVQAHGAVHGDSFQIDPLPAGEADLAENGLPACAAIHDGLSRFTIAIEGRRAVIAIGQQQHLAGLHGIQIGLRAVFDHRIGFRSGFRASGCLHDFRRLTAIGIMELQFDLVGRSRLQIEHAAAEPVRPGERLRGLLTRTRWHSPQRHAMAPFVCAHLAKLHFTNRIKVVITHDLPFDGEIGDRGKRRADLTRRDGVSGVE